MTLTFALGDITPPSAELFLNEPHHKKTCLQRFETRQDAKGPSLLQKLASVLEFRI